MRAADLIVKCLETHGIERVYCVPGESYLTLLDALYGSSIEIIICRHESGAGFMAIAEARLTRKPAVFLVSRGPGATNGSIAVHVAEQDATPVLLFIGQVSRTELTEHIYAQDFDRDSNTIEVFVARLRRKLGAALIETVRGLGYRIAVEP